jgi:agmatinase
MFESINLSKTAHYDGMKKDPADSKWIFFGAPFDGTSSYRAGSRFAPNAIRQETVLCQETYSCYFEKDLLDTSISDIGDLELPFGDTEKALRYIAQLGEEILSHDKKPFMVGGEHLVSFPTIHSVYKKYPDLRIIHLDAHADMADELFDVKWSHGTVMRRVWEIIGDKRLYQFGIRSASKEEFEFSKKHNYLQAFNLDGIEKHLDELRKYPIYLTIDLDCFDPSQIPGTGTPETGGVWFMDFIHFLKQISGLNFVGIDVNELAPRIDPTDMSTVFATKVIRETILACIK